MVMSVVQVLLISFGLIFQAKNAKEHAALVYPPVDCDG